MEDKRSGASPNVTNPTNSGQDQSPVDPSNTSNVGQSVEQGVVKIKEGISGQSSEWEDEQERSIPENSGISDKGENYLKKPSPEELNPKDDE